MYLSRTILSTLKNMENRDFHFQPIRNIGLPFLSETNKWKNRQNIGNNVFEDPTQQAINKGQWSLRDRKRGKCYECLSLLPRNHFQGTVQGGGKQVEPGRLSYLRRWSWESRETKTEFRGQSAREERVLQIEDSGDVWQAPLKYSSNYWSVTACKESFKGLERTLNGTQTEQE